MRQAVTTTLLLMATCVVAPLAAVADDASPEAESGAVDCGLSGVNWNMCPCHYGYAEGLILFRDNQAGNQPLVLDQTTDAPLISVGDLDFSAGGGFRALYGTRIDDCWALELGYLGLWGQEASATVSSLDNILIPGALGLNVNNFNSADSATVVYGSTLNSAEVNMVHCRCCCDCDTCSSLEYLFGFRYINFNENFSLTAVDAEESASTYAVRTNNNLYGAQTGVRMRRGYGLWGFESTGKIGIFGNEAYQSSPPILDFPGNFVRRGATSAATGQVSFLGDLNFSAIRQLNDIWNLRLGYNLIWIEGVALAPNQLDFSFSPASGQAINAAGGVFMHGVSAGLEARW